MSDQFAVECLHLLQQSMARISHCVDQLSHEQLWWQPAEKMNSIGVLLRHLAGNLQQWAVDGVSATSNDRNRDSEFESAERETATVLLGRLRSVVDEASKVIRRLPPNKLVEDRTIQGFRVSVLGGLMHTIPHFVGHTHQIVQLARMQLGDGYRFHWDPESAKDCVPL